MKTLASLLFVATIALGCNDVPMGDMQSSFHMRVNVRSQPASAVKVDFLWVVDDSSSMCQEQAALAASADAFLARIQSYVALDYRVAVVTTDVLSADHSGKFRFQRTTTFPRACNEAQPLACQSGDGACEGAFGQGWVCDGSSVTTNCNGSLNSSCRLTCATDADCDAALGEGYRCFQDANSACVRKPETEACPDSQTIAAMMEADTGGGHFLTNRTAPDLFKCIAVVGATGSDLESGLGASLLALDRAGPNAEQAAAFLRDDAYLVIVYLSDEDDCSTTDCAPGSSGCTAAGLVGISKEKAGGCLCLGDADSGGPLRSIDDAANRIKGLKKDPGHVLVASIVGDSLATTVEGVLADRAAFRDAKCTGCGGKKGPEIKARICASPSGSADYGGRYVDFTGRFGFNGVVQNLCAAEGIEPALERIGDRVILTLTKVCLPLPFGYSDGMVVTAHGPGGDAVLPECDEGVEGTCWVLVPAADCPSTGAAVVLDSPVAPDTSIEVDYAPGQHVMISALRN